jgi:hypothetical protein
VTTIFFVNTKGWVTYADVFPERVCILITSSFDPFSCVLSKKELSGSFAMQQSPPERRRAHEIRGAVPRVVGELGLHPLKEWLNP